MTVAEIRQQWWIQRCQQKVKLVLRCCVTCLKVTGKSYIQPLITPLPDFCLQEACLFEVVGLDYTGGLFVKSEKRERKVYVVAFTYTYTHTVHLELVNDNSTQSFLQSFRRFLSRRSKQRLIISDNVTSFLAASKTLVNIFKDSVVESHLVKEGIEWKFITPKATWTSGFYVRLIAIIKVTLKNALGEPM